MELDPSIAALEHRLGRDSFRRRLRVEHALQSAVHRFSTNPKSNLAKLLMRSRLLHRAMRLVGLYQIGYRQFLSPRVVTRDVPLAGLPAALEGVTILQLSDLHLDLDPGLGQVLAPLLDGLPYDLAVITGDFRNLLVGPAEPAIAATVDLLRHLRGPVYLVAGNHDSLGMIPPLEAAGARFLLNEHVLWSRGHARLVLAGVDDAVYHGTHDLDRAFAGAPNDAPRVLLSHSPAIYAEAAAHRVNLLLAGHTHGGQICLPGGHIPISGLRCPRRYLRGAWSCEKMQGYTSAGTGASGVPLRFNCPAEVTLHRLVRG